MLGDTQVHCGGARSAADPTPLGDGSEGKPPTLRTPGWAAALEHGLSVTKATGEWLCMVVE